MNNNNKEKCPKYTIYTEDFCITFCNDYPECKCTSCYPFKELFRWLEEKKYPLSDRIVKKTN